MLIQFRNCRYCTPPITHQWLHAATCMAVNRSIIWVVGWLVVLGFLAKEFRVDVFMGALDDLYGSSAQWHGQNRERCPQGNAPR